MYLFFLGGGKVPLLKSTTEKGYPYSILSTGGLGISKICDASGAPLGVPQKAKAEGRAGHHRLPDRRLLQGRQRGRKIEFGPSMGVAFVVSFCVDPPKFGGFPVDVLKQPTGNSAKVEVCVNCSCGIVATVILETPKNFGRCRGRSKPGSWLSCGCSGSKKRRPPNGSRKKTEKQDVGPRGLLSGSYWRAKGAGTWSLRLGEFVYRRILGEGPPAIGAKAERFCFRGRGQPPTKIDIQKKRVTLILASLLEDLVGYPEKKGETHRFRNFGLQ